MTLRTRDSFEYQRSPPNLRNQQTNAKHASKYETASFLRDRNGDAKRPKRDCNVELGPFTMQNLSVQLAKGSVHLLGGCKYEVSCWLFYKLAWKNRTNASFLSERNSNAKRPKRDCNVELGPFTMQNLSVRLAKGSIRLK